MQSENETGRRSNCSGFDSIMKNYQFVKPGERVKDVHFTDDVLAVDLIDGRTIIVPWLGFHDCSEVNSLSC